MLDGTDWHHLLSPSSALLEQPDSPSSPPPRPSPPHTPPLPIVTKTPAGIEEVVVQGDVSDEVVDLIEGGVGVFAGSGIGQGNVEVVEEKKKGGG